MSTAEVTIAYWIVDINITLQVSGYTPVLLKNEGWEYVTNPTTNNREYQQKTSKRAYRVNSVSARIHVSELTRDEHGNLKVPDITVNMTGNWSKKDNRGWYQASDYAHIAYDQLPAWIQAQIMTELREQMKDATVMVNFIDEVVNNTLGEENVA